MYRAAVLTGIVLLAVAPPVAAQTTAWTTLATVPLHPGRDGEAVTVRTNQQPFREIRVCADRQSVRLTELRVNFVRGNRQQIAIQRTLQSRACTRPSSLRQRSAIRSIYVGHGRVRARSPLATVRVQVR